MMDDKNSIESIEMPEIHSKIHSATSVLWAFFLSNFTNIVVISICVWGMYCVLCVEISDLYQLLTKKSFETTLKQLQNEMS